MADPVLRPVAARLSRPPIPAGSAQRWEIAEVLARVEAALARRRAA